jgi:hypothetical protein
MRQTGENGIFRAKWGSRNNRKLAKSLENLRL